MNTQKPLADLIPEILAHIEKHQPLIARNQELFDIHGGKLLAYLYRSVEAELESTQSIKATKQRLPAINLLNRVVSKLSKVYVEPASRTAESPTDQEILESLESDLNIDQTMANANVLLNLTRYVSLEPFLSATNGIQVRVIPAHQHLVFSDSPENPMQPTVFIKFAGTAPSLRLKNGVPKSESVSVYYLYSDSEFLVIDSEGSIRPERMGENANGINPFGVIPFVYISLDPYRLLPERDEDSFQFQMLIPKLLADLNYASKFLSHSLSYIIDGEPVQSAGGLKATPDSVWMIKSEESSGKTAAIGTITPSVDSDKVLRLIGQQLSMWLETKNIKTSATGTLSAGSAISGIAKLIDESDASAEIQKQSIIFTDVERRFWQLIKLFHNLAAKAGIGEEKRQLSRDFHVSIKHGEIKPYVSNKERLDQIKLKLDSGLTSKKRAIREANPHLTDFECDQLLEEIEQERNPQVLEKVPA